MIKCALCGNETKFPCGPKDHEVCPSCWLAIGCDDFLCLAPNLEVAVDMAEDLRRKENSIAKLEEMEL